MQYFYVGNSVLLLLSIHMLLPMLIFMLKVCCNACKKPVKASQYAAHAGFSLFFFFYNDIFHIILMLTAGVYGIEISSFFLKKRKLFIMIIV